MSKQPTLVLMAGAAGSGKSFVRSNNEELANLPVVDADQFKMSHPEYDPKNPGALHAWSSKEAMQAFFAAVGKGESFIYDGTGASTEKYVNFAKQAQAAGFQVKLVYVKVSLATSLKRNAERARTVAEEIVREQHSLIPTSIEILSGYVDSMEVINND